MSDLVGNPEDRFSGVAAHFIYLKMVDLRYWFILVPWRDTRKPPVRYQHVDL